MRARVLVRREVLDALTTCDALLCPTTLQPPARIEAARETIGSPEDMERKVLLRRISTYPFSMANVPAIALPMGFSGAGLPLSRHHRKTGSDSASSREVIPRSTQRMLMSEKRP